MKKITHQFICFLFLMTALSYNPPLYGQNFSYNGVVLSEVSYYGSGRINITHDVNQSMIFPNKGWDKTGAKNPIAYVSGSFPRVKAVFEINCSPASEIWVKGVNADGYNFAPKKLVIENGVWIYSELTGTPGWNSVKQFASSTVDLWENFEITWSISDSPTSLKWTPIGTSVHPMYVTYATPLISIVFHSVIYHGCKNAKGLSNELNVVNNAYNAFVNHDIMRRDNPQPLIYWNPSFANPLSSLFCYSVDGLLYYGDGTCGAFADFFHKMIQVQGIAGSSSSEVTVSWASGYDLPYLIYIHELTPDLNALATNTYGLAIVPPDYNQDGNFNDNFRAMFFVNNWLFPTDRRFYGIAASINIPLAAPLVGVKTLPASDQTGVDGQNNNNPRAFFENHAIVKYNNAYYDPSYGTASPKSAADWEAFSLAGFGTFGLMLIQLADGSFDVKEFIWKRESNTPATQVIIP